MLALIGVAAGLAVAAALMRVMTSLLFEAQPVDPVTYAAVAIALVVGVLFAPYMPARRATIVEPITALRD